MSLPLLREWQAFADMYPIIFSPEYRQSRADWNAGMMAAVFSNTMTGLWAKRGTRYSAGDLMFKEKSAVQRKKSPKELYVLWKTAVTGGANNN